MTSRYKSIFCAALTTGLVAALLQWIILREGLRCNPDGWSYWQGSVTLMNGAGYRLFSGEPIIDWPPLYSWYLAMWQFVFGVSGATVLASTIVSTGISAFGWVVMLLATIKPAAGVGARWSCLFVAVMFAQATRHLMSESLANIFLPGLLGFAVHAASAPSSRRYLLASAAAGGFGALLLLTRHASIAFLAGAGVLLLCNRSHGWWLRLRGGALFSVLALAPAMISEAMLPAVASRTVEFGVAKFGPFDYVLQATEGIGDRLLGSWFGFAAWLFAMWIGLSPRVAEPMRKPFRHFLVFTIVALAVLYVLFNLTFINTELKGRMVLFVPLITISVFLMLLPTLSSKRLQNVLLALLVGVSVGKATKHAIKGRAADSSLSDAEVLADNFVRPHFTIELDHFGQPPIARDGGQVLVSPPEFPTHDALLRAHRAANRKSRK